LNSIHDHDYAHGKDNEFADNYTRNLLLSATLKSEIIFLLKLLRQCRNIEDTGGFHGTEKEYIHQ
jgi:hypothetical protein